MAAGVRRWAPFALVLVGPAAALLVTLLHPGPSGHWSGHLAAAGGSVGVAVALVVGLCVVRPRLPAAALASLVVVGAGLALEAVGNIRAARSLWETTYDDAEAGTYGPLYDGYEWGHTVAERGDTVVILGSLAFAVALGLHRRVGVRVAVAGGVLAFWPPWVYPALGPVLLLAWVHARARTHDRAAAPDPPVVVPTE
ncbi:hypothetical protein GON03_04470 [Nocardioides sp. MAH-18]|uniref:Uncharacterized protein n=1 Tax=Nocardioides agri TaxID=2682843 RepID=A0A6L6XNY1_9ACTN|nr:MULTISPECIES: hypothetical protein [unclassified Nocardioides]MBA2953556.1 hypothetical protein [Nocardioides sp. CGMCC 1.13656]MVQ48423.1 hypothetical protein [Nocardioides sp. MAH-18]